VDGDRVLISYGSSDTDARLLALGLPDLEALFTRPFDCSGAKVLDAGSGEALAVAAVTGGAPAAGANGTAAGAAAQLRQRHRRARRRERSAA
jgi:hypothetical protein